MAIVTVSEIRSLSGIKSDLVDDATIKTLIETTENKLQSLVDVRLTPTKKIETLKGEYKDKIMVEEHFPLTVYKVVNGSSEIDLKNIYVNTEEGLLELYGDSISSGFPYAGNRFSQYDLDVKVKYLFGMIQKDNNFQTETTTETSSGSNVNIEVSNSGLFNVGDYVFIEDTNRAKEVFKITVIPDSTHITAEILVNDYETDALITKTTTHDLFKQYVKYESSVAVAVNAIGGTYTFNTGYSLGPLSTQKGVPFTHFDRVVRENIKMRDDVLVRIRQLLGSIV